MKCAIFLALLALTTATPLSGWTGWSHAGINSGNWAPVVSQSQHKLVAHQVAQEIVHEAHRQQQAQIQQAILHLQQQQWQPEEHIIGVPTIGPHSVAQKLSQQVSHQALQAETQQAIQHLQLHLQEQQLHEAASSDTLGPVGQATGPLGTVGHHLQHTIEAVVEAQLVSDSIQNNGMPIGPNVVSGSELGADVLHTRIQKIIDQINIHEVEGEISHHHHWAQQLQLQQQLVNQQKIHIETQKSLGEHRGVSPQQVQQLEQVHLQLEQQEQHLVEQQVVHQIVAQQLQHVLVHHQEQLQQDTTAEHIKEHESQWSNHLSWPRWH